MVLADEVVDVTTALSIIICSDLHAPWSTSCEGSLSCKMPLEAEFVLSGKNEKTNLHVHV